MRGHFDAAAYSCSSYGEPLPLFDAAAYSCSPHGEPLPQLKTNRWRAAAGTFWFIIRGIEAYPVLLGDIELPPTGQFDCLQLQLAHSCSRDYP